MVWRVVYVGKATMGITVLGLIPKHSHCTCTHHRPNSRTLPNFTTQPQTIHSTQSHRLTDVHSDTATEVFLASHLPTVDGWTWFHVRES